jgi:hypothetical protein
LPTWNAIAIATRAAIRHDGARRILQASHGHTRGTLRRWHGRSRRLATKSWLERMKPRDARFAGRAARRERLVLDRRRLTRFRIAAHMSRAARNVLAFAARAGGAFVRVAARRHRLDPCPAQGRSPLRIRGDNCSPPFIA